MSIMVRTRTGLMALLMLAGFGSGCSEVDELSPSEEVYVNAVPPSPELRRYVGVPTPPSITDRFPDHIDFPRPVDPNLENGTSEELAIGTGPEIVPVDPYEGFAHVRTGPTIQGRPLFVVISPTEQLEDFLDSVYTGIEATFFQGLEMPLGDQWRSRISSPVFDLPINVFVDEGGPCHGQSLYAGRNDELGQFACVPSTGRDLEELASVRSGFYHEGISHPMIDPLFSDRLPRAWGEGLALIMSGMIQDDPADRSFCSELYDTTLWSTDGLPHGSAEKGMLLWNRLCNEHQLDVGDFPFITEGLIGEQERVGNKLSLPASLEIINRYLTERDGQVVDIKDTLRDLEIPEPFLYSVDPSSDNVGLHFQEASFHPSRNDLLNVYFANTTPGSSLGSVVTVAVRGQDTDWINLVENRNTGEIRPYGITVVNTNLPMGELRYGDDTGVRATVRILYGGGVEEERVVNGTFYTAPNLPDIVVRTTYSPLRGNTCRITDEICNYGASRTGMDTEVQRTLTFEDGEERVVEGVVPSLEPNQCSYLSIPCEAMGVQPGDSFTVATCANQEDRYQEVDRENNCRETENYVLPR